MKNFNKIIIIVILAASFIFANFNQHNTRILNINDIFPVQFAGWTSSEVKVDKVVYSILSKKELLSRKYSKNNNSFVLDIVSTNNRESIHYPEECYAGSGLKIIQRSVIAVSPTLKTTLITLQRGTKKFQIMYWFTDLDKNFSNRPDFMKSNVIKKVLNHKLKTYGLVTINSTFNNEKELIEFARATESELNKISLSLEKDKKS